MSECKHGVSYDSWDYCRLCEQEMPEDEIRTAEQAAEDIEAAALHVLANADSDEGAQLTSAILYRAANIARNGLSA